jgi:outer membrane protein OmpA-like peptidoglycan-associated protein
MMLKPIGVMAALLLVAGCASEPKTYPVFFSQDATVITPEAQSVIAQIAQRNAEQRPAHIIVEGQADGGTAQDTELAEARADRVAAALAASGIDPARIERHPGTPESGATGIAARKVLVTFAP